MRDWREVQELVIPKAAGPVMVGALLVTVDPEERPKSLVLGDLGPPEEITGKTRIRFTVELSQQHQTVEGIGERLGEREWMRRYQAPLFPGNRLLMIHAICVPVQAGQTGGGAVVTFGTFAPEALQDPQILRFAVDVVPGADK